MAEESPKPLQQLQFLHMHVLENLCLLIFNLKATSAWLNEFVKKRLVLYFVLYTTLSLLQTISCGHYLLIGLVYGSVVYRYMINSLIYPQS